jgi:DNA invertase Pin-like site-specific DNA recombinase
MNNTEPYFIGYARVSTPSQSCENQIKIFLDIGVKRGHIWSDEGVSGILPPNERPQYQEMKAYLMNHKTEIKGVYIFQVSRLGRDPLSTLQEMLWYLENHIDLIPTSESDKIYSTLPDEFKPLLMGILTFLANMEREQLKQKINAGIEMAKARGQKFGRKTKKPDFKKIDELKKKYGWSTRAALRFTGTNENTYYKYAKLEKTEEPNGFFTS